jgi:hypothetical protein
MQHGASWGSSSAALASSKRARKWGSGSESYALSSRVRWASGGLAVGEIFKGGANTSAGWPRTHGALVVGPGDVALRPTARWSLHRMCRPANKAVEGASKHLGFIDAASIKVKRRTAMSK